jgi:hypothetical protein
MTLKNAAKLLGTGLILAVLSLGPLFTDARYAWADDNAANSIDSPAGSSGSSSQTYTNARHIGLGLAWAPMDMVQGNGTDVFSNTGFVDARYWFNDRFGLSGGLGFGFPQVSPQSSFLATLNVEPMITIISRRHTLFYANLDLIPALNTGAGLPSSLTLSAGLGIESTVTDIPKLAWFAQWNPVSLNWGFPNGGPTVTGVTFMGSLMNVMIGFHYYL